jgi:hypothetical protein
MTAILTCDVFSFFHSSDKDRKPYGRKGGKVTIISDRGNVLIVENTNKERFPVTICELKINNTNG